MNCDPLTGGRMTLARRSDRGRVTIRPTAGGGGAARRRLCGATAEKRDQAEHAHAGKDAVPVHVARGSGTGTARLVVSTRQVYLQCRAFTDGLTTGSSVHLGRLVGPCLAGFHDVHGDVHGLLLRVAQGIDEVDGPTLDRQTDRTEEDRLGLSQ